MFDRQWYKDTTSATVRATGMYASLWEQFKTLGKGIGVLIVLGLIVGCQNGSSEPSPNSGIIFVTVTPSSSSPSVDTPLPPTAISELPSTPQSERPQAIAATLPPTQTPTQIDPAIPEATDTPVPTPTGTLTSTPTETLTLTPTESLASSPTRTLTSTPTGTLTPTPTGTFTPTPTGTFTPTPTGTLTPTPTESLTPTPTATPTLSPLKKNDPLPTGIEEQLGFVSPGFHICFGYSDDPLILYKAGNVSSIEEATDWELAREFNICFQGFKSGLPIDAQVTLPNGVIQPIQPEFDHVDPDQNWGFWKWTTLPNDPLGDYLVTATQGATQTTRAFTVRQASSPRILVLTKCAEPGDTFQIALAGFQSGEAFYLYRYLDSAPDHFHPWYYATMLTLPQVDSEGNAIYNLNTQSDDPPGTYLLGTYLMVKEGEDNSFVKSDPQVFKVGDCFP